MNDFKKILLINFGGIGDEILFLPTINTLKKVFPNSHITLALESRSKSIINLTDLIDQVFEVNINSKNKYLELFKLILFARKNKFNMVISSGSNKFIPILLLLMNIKERYGYNNGITSHLLTEKVNLNKNQYASYMYHDLLRPITDIKCELPKIEIKPNVKWSLQNQIYKEENSVLIHPGVSKMSIEKNIIKIFKAPIWANIINRLLSSGKKVYLAGGPDDETIIREILSLIDTQNPLFYNMYGKTKNLEQLAQLIKKSEVVICSDSAPMHISIAVNTKTLAIFGPTDEKKLLPPDNKNFIAVTNNCNCRPCLWDKRMTSCKNLFCLNFDIDDIIKYI